jgi:amino acid adenylation domain-containing protein
MAADDELGLSLPERFEAVVERHRLRPAFVGAAWQPNYGELNSAANRLAHAVLDRGGQQGDRVAIAMELGAPAVTAMLAVLKAGRTVVALNPTDPPARLREILQDSEASLIVSDEPHRALAAELAPRIEALHIEDCGRGERTHNPRIPISEREGAFLSYTSGSTGRSKGVVQTHGYVYDHVRRYSPPMQFVAEDRILLLSSFAVSLGIGTTWCALFNGAALCPFPVAVKGVTGLADWMTEQRITVYVSSASLFRHFVQTLPPGVAFPDMRVVRLTAEAVEHEDYKAFCRHFPPHCAFVNGLSLTEAGNVANLRLAHGDIAPVGRLPVGRVSEGIEVILVDERGGPVARGETGEIVVKGRRLAAGYWRDDALTAARFSDWSDEFGYGAVRTGDLGRFNAEGLLEFLGRKDDRVKIRGYRIELSEVEAALRRLPDMADAAVCVFEQPARGAQLVAYVVPRPSQQFAPATVRRRLRSVLPDSMVPSIVMIVERLPYSAQGKIDRRALMTLHPPLPARTGADRTLTGVESLLCEIWQDAFHLAGLGPQDDFFELGGDSLVAAVIAAGVHAATRIELNLQYFSDHPTIERLASVIEEMRKGNPGQTAPALVRIARDGALPLSSAQERIWDMCRDQEVAAKFLAFSRHQIEGPLDVRAFHKCLTAIFRRHEILRTTFPESRGGPTLLIGEPAPAPLTFINLSETPGAEAQAEQIFEQEKAKPFDLARDLPLRFVLVRLRSDLHWLLRIAHHIVTDKHSWDVIANELGLLYEAELAGESSPLPEFEPLQYCDYVAWQRSRSSDHAAYREMIAWWKTAIAGATASELPFERRKVLPDVAPTEGVIFFKLKSAASKRLGALRREQGATYFVVRLAAFVAVLVAESGRSDAVIGGYVSLRNQLPLQNMLGDFSNVVIYRYRLEPSLGFRAWVSQVQKRYVETEAHCVLPHEQLRMELARAGVDLPLPHVIFLGYEPERPVRFGGLRMTNLGTGPNTMPWGFTFSPKGDDDDDDGLVSFDAARYEPAGVRKTIDRYCRLLELASAEPDRSVGDLLKMTGSGGWRAWLPRYLW